MKPKAAHLLAMAMTINPHGTPFRIQREECSKEAQQAKIAKAQEKRERRMARNRRNIA